MRTASAYTYRLERVGYRDFLTPIDNNRWIATTFVWLSIGHRLADANRCQLTNKASIVIDSSIDFPIIGFVDCSRPVYVPCLSSPTLMFEFSLIFCCAACSCSLSHSTLSLYRPVITDRHHSDQDSNFDELPSIIWRQTWPINGLLKVQEYSLFYLIMCWNVINNLPSIMFKNFGRIGKETISKLGSCVGSWTILVRHIGVESRRPISSRAQIEAITQISDVRNEYSLGEVWWIVWGKGCVRITFTKNILVRLQFTGIPLFKLA